MKGGAGARVLGNAGGRGLRASPVTASALGDGLVAGALGWALGGVPSTAWMLARGENPLVSVRAAGTLVLAEGCPAPALLAAGVAAHTVLSLGWGVVFSLALPERRTVPAAVAAGLAVAALDLGAVARRYPALRALAMPPQVADHLAYGALVGAALQRCRRRRPAPSPS